MDPLFVCIAVTVLAVLISPVLGHFRPRSTFLAAEAFADTGGADEPGGSRLADKKTSDRHAPQKPPKAPPDVQAPPAAEPAAPSPAKHPPKPTPHRPRASIISGCPSDTEPKPGATTLRGRIADLENVLAQGGPNPAMALSAMLEVARAKQLLNEDGHLVDENGDLLKNPFAAGKALQQAYLAIATAEAAIGRSRPLTDTPSPRPVGRLFFSATQSILRNRGIRRPFHSTHSRNIESGRAQIRSGRSTER